jgi:hypothetical protein
MNQAHKLFKALRYRLTSRVICDNCGKSKSNILKTKVGYSRYVLNVVRILVKTVQVKQ